MQNYLFKPPLQGTTILEMCHQIFSFLTIDLLTEIQFYANIYFFFLSCLYTSLLNFIVRLLPSLNYLHEVICYYTVYVLFSGSFDFSS